MNPAEITAWTANQERTRAAYEATLAYYATGWRLRKPCVVCGTSTRRVNNICPDCEEKR